MQLPSLDAIGQTVRASRVATGGQLVAAYESGYWSCWPEAELADIDLATRAVLGLADEPSAPPNGMRFVVVTANGATVVQVANKRAALAALAVPGQPRYLVAINADGSLCSVTPPGAPAVAVQAALESAPGAALQPLGVRRG